MSEPSPGDQTLPFDGSRPPADAPEATPDKAQTQKNSALPPTSREAAARTESDQPGNGDDLNRTLFAEPGSAPDGMCADAEGAIWYASVPGQRCTRVAEGGEVLDTVAADRGCFACMLGGEARRTLFMLAQEWDGASGMKQGGRTGQVLTTDAPAAGAGWP